MLASVLPFPPSAASCNQFLLNHFLCLCVVISLFPLLDPWSPLASFFHASVLQTLDMQHSLPAQEIREKLKHLMDLYKQITAETASAECSNNSSFSRHFPGQFQNIPRPLNVESQTAQPPSYPEPGFAVMHQYKKPNPVKTRGTYLVGGSTLGWNFITYPGEKSVSYGRTKKSFRAARSKLPKK